MVENVGPPRIKIIPKLEKQKINTRMQEAVIAGCNNGRVTLINTCHGLAPRTMAASFIRPWREDQNPVIILNMTEKL